MAGTRITAESILERLAAGETVDDVLAAHPQLERADVQAAFAYAVSVLRMDVAGSVSKSADGVLVQFVAGEGIDGPIVDRLRPGSMRAN